MSIAEELRKLDQEWEAEQQAYLIQGSHNNSARIPTRAASIIGGVLVGGMGGFWMVTAFSMIPGDGFFARVFPWSGLLFVFAGLYYAVSGVIKAGRYQAGLKRYRQRRRELMNRSGKRKRRR